jgi:hypothetical protein
MAFGERMNNIQIALEDMKQMFEETVFDFEDFLILKDLFDGLYDLAANRFLQLYWLQSQKRFLDIKQFSCETDYQYNDEFYELNFDYKVNDKTVYQMYKFDDWCYANDDTYEETPDKQLTEYMNFWLGHKELFDNFYGSDYEFSIDNNNISVKRWQRPDDIVLER